MTTIYDVTFNRVGLWQVRFVSQNDKPPVSIYLTIVGGRIEQVVEAARKIIREMPRTYPAEDFMLCEATAIDGGAFIPMSGDLLDKKKAPAAPKGDEGRVLRMVPKPPTAS